MIFFGEFSTAQSTSTSRGTFKNKTKLLIGNNISIFGRERGRGRGEGRRKR
jgi:hypothetical protein